MKNRSSPFAGITQIKFYVAEQGRFSREAVLLLQHYGISQINFKNMPLLESHDRPWKLNTRLQVLVCSV
jgi:hypothetical protein